MTNGNYVGGNEAKKKKWYREGRKRRNDKKTITKPNNCSSLPPPDLVEFGTKTVEDAALWFAVQRTGKRPKLMRNTTSTLAFQRRLIKMARKTFKPQEMIEGDDLFHSTATAKQLVSAVSSHHSNSQKRERRENITITKEIKLIFRRLASRAPPLSMASNFLRLCSLSCGFADCWMDFLRSRLFPPSWLCRGPEGSRRSKSWKFNSESWFLELLE